MNATKSLEIATLNEVQEFVENNVVQSRKEEIRCGDGRITPEQSRGAVRGFGEDYGMILAILATADLDSKNIDYTKIIDSYLEAVREERGENPKLYMHSDTHTVESGGIGCGHVRLSQNEENGFGVSEDIAKGLFQEMFGREELDLLVVEGEHAEQGALLVFSDKNEEGNRFSINSIGKDGNGSYFVADMNAILDHLETVVPKVSRALGVELKPEEVMKTYERQQGESARILAISKGLKLYNVFIDKVGTATVEEFNA